MQKINIEINAKLICQFDKFQHWVNHASSYLGGLSRGTLLCLDKDGNACDIGADFMKARDKDRFPVSCYLIEFSRNIK